MAEENVADLQSELDFLTAMQAYRRAKDSGDRAAIAEAERALQEQVRAELQQREGGCA